MTLRTKTLTAVAALSIFATGFAVAQDAKPVADEVTQETEANPEASTGEAVAAEAGAEEAAAEEPATEEQPAEGDSTDAGAAAPEAEEASAEASAEDAAAEESTAEEPAAEEGTDEHDEAGHDEHAEGEHDEGSGGHGSVHIEDVAFSFEGPFGSYDQFQLQRGLQVYTEVCAACHGLKFVPIRTLHDEGGPGLPEDQVRAYAANFTVVDKETGEDRPGLPTDHFPANTAAGAPDLSLMAKARAGFHGPYGTGLSQLINGIGGPEYIHALLTSYTGEEVEQAGTVLYGNSAYSTGATAMPPPLSEDLVTYEDGTPATVDQMSRDVSAFLMWTAEPKMMDRKQVGLVSVLFLIVLSVLLYLTNKRLWAPHKGKNLDK